MSWLWSSPAPPVSPPPSQSIPESTPHLQQPNTPSPSPPNRKLTRDELADHEFHNFLQALEADASFSSTKHQDGPSPTPSSSNNSSKRKNSSMTDWETRPAQIGSETDTERNLSLEESLLPTEMSCRNAFDMAFLCQSFGGQFNNVYRYGNVRSCSDHWSAFWFCMRTRGMLAGDKAERIRNHYKHRALKYKVGPSSEDVWESRDAKLDWGEAFNEPIDSKEVVSSDAEWNRREEARREGLRKE